MNQLIKEDHAGGFASGNHSMNMQPKVAILLCTFNGQKFLQEQLDSFEAQTYSNWVLYVSDDGSSDKTLQIIGDFVGRVGKDKVNIFKGPRKGFAANFLSLIHRNEIEADFFAFADQDDVWLPKKIEIALSWLMQQSVKIPALYCSRTLLIDATGKIFGRSDLFSRPPSFANALVQSIGGGNTMMLNLAARNLVSEHSPEDGIVSHDWWIYILVSGNSGAIKYDPVGHVLYRQHDGNLVGMNGTWIARIRRAIQLFRGRFRRWNDIHVDLISKSPGFMTQDNVDIFLSFKRFREKPFISRVAGLRSSCLYRQTRLGDAGLVVGNIFKKI